MDVKEIVKKIKAGEIRINSCNHCVNDILDSIEMTIDVYKDIAEKDYVKSICGLNPSIGQKVTDSEIYCFDCGQRGRMFWVAEDEIAFIDTHELRKRRGDQYKKSYTKDDVTDCPLTEKRRLGYHNTFVNFPTGKVVFQNFFREEAMFDHSDPKHRYRPGINCIAGRIELADDLATRNVGYGQMGNMSATVFLAKDCKSIIISDGYYWDDEGFEQERKYNNYICIGSICLDVWRWQCADLETIKKYGEECKFKITDTPSKPNDENYKDVYLLHVVPGRWKIEHRFDYMTHDDEKDPNMYYSKLTLIENENENNKKRDQSSIEMLCQSS